MYQIGDKVNVISDNENYDFFKDLILIVEDAEIGGNGYDEGLYPQQLLSFYTLEGVEIPFSLYEYEVELS